MNCIVVDRNTPMKQLRKLLAFDLDGTLRQIIGHERLMKMSEFEKSVVQKFSDAELSRFVNKMAA